MALDKKIAWSWSKIFSSFFRPLVKISWNSPLKLLPSSLNPHTSLYSLSFSPLLLSLSLVAWSNLPCVPDYQCAFGCVNSLFPQKAHQDLPLSSADTGRIRKWSDKKKEEKKKNKIHPVQLVFLCVYLHLCVFVCVCTHVMFVSSELGSLAVNRNDDMEDGISYEWVTVTFPSCMVKCLIVLLC